MQRGLLLLSVLVLAGSMAYGSSNGLNNIPTADTTGNLQLVLGSTVTMRLAIARHDLMFRADAIQVNRQHDWAASFGGISPVAKHFAMEAWVTKPTGGYDAGFTLKVDLVLPL